MTHTIKTLFLDEMFIIKPGKSQPRTSRIFNLLKILLEEHVVGPEVIVNENIEFSFRSKSFDNRLLSMFFKIFKFWNQNFLFFFRATIFEHSNTVLRCNIEFVYF